MKTTPLPPSRPVAGINPQESTGDSVELVTTSAAPKSYQDIAPEAIRTALQAQGRATPDQIDSFVWLQAHGREQGVKGLAALGKLIGYGGAVVSQLFSGKYPGDLRAVANAIEDYRPLWASRQSLGGEPLLNLSPAVAIDKFCGQVRASATIGVIWSRSHVGKTKGINLYASRHPDTTTLVTMPPGGSALKFLKALGEKMRISRKPGQSLEDAIIAKLSPQHQLIVDQVHRTILGKYMQMATLDLLVEFHDASGCSEVLVGTPTFIAAMQDQRNALFMEQIENRGVARLQLPAELPYSDGVKLALAYGLPEPKGADRTFLADLLKNNRLGRITKFLRLARSGAAEIGEPFNWGHVEEMMGVLADWSKGVGVYEDGGAEEEGGAK